MRIFAGLPLPPRAVDALSALRLRWAAPGDGLRWTPPEQWHLTLHFFGDLDTPALEQVKSRLSAIRHSPVFLHLEDLGQFPSKGLLYASVEPSQALSSLHQEVLQCAGPQAAHPASKPFHPHITLARSRNRTGPRTLARLCTPEWPRLGPITWTAPALHLYESVLGPEGAAYTLLATVPLSEL